MNIGGAFLLLLSPGTARAEQFIGTHQISPDTLNPAPGEMSFHVEFEGGHPHNCAAPADILIQVEGPGINVEGIQYGNVTEYATSTWDFEENWSYTWKFNFEEDDTVQVVWIGCEGFNDAYLMYDASGSALQPPIRFNSDLLDVFHGGTGVNGFITNGVLLGNASSSIQATAAGSANQVLRIPSGGGAPSFGALDLSQSAAVTGTLPVVRGGTGSATVFTTGSLVFAGSGGAYLQDNGNLFWDDTNNRLGIGTSSPQSRLEVNGTAASIHQKGIGATPGVAAGAGAGTGGSASIVGTDAAGRVSVTLGLLPATNSPTVTVTYATAYASAPYVVFSPANLDTTGLTGSRAVYVTSTTSGFTIMSGSLALLASGDLEWNYQVVE